VVDLIDIKNLTVHFRSGGLIHNLLGKSQTVYAVNGVNLKINERETVGLIGESGCGKTTTGRAILRLVDDVQGNIFYRSDDVYALSGKKLQQFRRKAQMIFQDPISALNPRMKAGDIIAEPLKIHANAKSKAEVEAEVDNLLEEVGLLRNDKSKYPQEFSGGQAQRIVVARALAVHPEFIVCDEPTSGLDVSIGAKIINFMKKIKERHNLTLLWITHDLGVVKYLCDQVAIMYLGKIVEQGNAAHIFGNALHPYTQALLSATPFISAKQSGPILLEGEVPSSIEKMAGCGFCSRCWKKDATCEKIEPLLRSVENDHLVACHKVE
jgi:peptide/nickel transport system ATP-binding protein/oligopeptide transport system ATP-binding protein